MVVMMSGYENNMSEKDPHNRIIKMVMIMILLTMMVTAIIMKSIMI